MGADFWALRPGRNRPDIEALVGYAMPTPDGPPAGNVEIFAPATLDELKF